MAVNPYLAYNVRVKWDGRYVAAVTSVSGLSHAPQRLDSRSSSSLKIPGQTDYEPVRLERGITTDREFETWARLMWNYPNTGPLDDEVSLKGFRKPMQIELYNQAGQLVMRYDVYNCWPSEYLALPELEGNANVVALARMTIEHEGWDRDTSVTPPP